MIINVQSGQLPQGFCPPDLQTMLNGFSAQQFVTINSVASIIVSSTPPGASDHDKAWLQLDSSGRPVRLYFFAQGAWLSQHPLPPGFTMIWNQALPNFQTFDGGDASAPPFASISGQMWQLMSTTLDGLGTQVAQAQFPVGVGTTPAPPAGTGTVIGVAGVGGEELHKLTNSEMFPHAHVCKATTAEGGARDTLVLTGHLNLNDPGQQPDDRTLIQGGDPATGNPPTNSLGHNTLPPYYGVYFIQRTNRLFYVV